MKHKGKTIKMRSSCCTTRRNEGGFTLVEVAISVVILSFILGIGATLIPRLAHQYQEEGTYERMQLIHKAISTYAQKHNRIPCPAEPDTTITAQPFGTERGSGANGQNIGACTSQASRHGIVPFRTLGLTLEDVRDSFGNFFTYRVSRTPTMAFNPATGYLNNWCRSLPRWHDGVNDLDPEKAAFCCGHSPSNAISGWIAQDISVEGPFGPLPHSRRNINNYGGTLAEYSQVGDPVPTQATLQNTFVPSFAAYALISHGPNGLGSYNREDGTQKQGRYLSNYEEDNATPAIAVTYVQDNTVDDPNAGDPGAGIKDALDFSQIDDIISWRSPFQIYGMAGQHASCAEARP